MKRLVILILLGALLATAVGALATQATPEEAARSVMPENAEFLRNARDDGFEVYYFSTPDGTRYEVDVNPSDNSVVRVDMDAADTRGSSAVVLTQQQAEEAVLNLYPGATIYFSTLEEDDRRYSYEVYFSTDAFSGRVELNAETGAVLESELDYSPASRVQSEGPLTADQARELVLSLVENGRITDFETDRENGRTVYEGEVNAGGMSYDFVIDAESGRITEWEMERN